MAKKKDIKVPLHTLSVAELQAQLREREDQHFRLRFRHASTKLTNPMQIRQARRDVARLKTILHQKEREAA